MSRQYNLSGKIETTANVATIIVAVLLSAVLTKVYLLPAAPRATAPGFEVTRGKTMDGHLLGMDWPKNHLTLILAISTTCHFCTESAPFFRRLEVEAGKDVRMVAVLPQPVAESQRYLSQIGVHVEVKQASLSALGVRGTPTLLLVNNVGVVTDVWTGKLDPNEEARVLTILKKNTGVDKAQQ